MEPKGWLEQSTLNLDPPAWMSLKNVLALNLILGRKLPWFDPDLDPDVGKQRGAVPENGDLLQAQIAYVRNDKLERATVNPLGKRLLEELRGSSSLAEHGAQAAWLFAACTARDPAAMFVLAQAKVPIRAATVLRCALDLISCEDPWTSDEDTSPSVEMALSDLLRGGGIKLADKTEASVANAILSKFDYGSWRATEWWKVRLLAPVA
jgi:hypothetical protein